jgi:hypothetical protein
LINECRSVPAHSEVSKGTKNVDQRMFLFPSFVIHRTYSIVTLDPSDPVAHSLAVVVFPVSFEFESEVGEAVVPPSFALVLSLALSLPTLSFEFCLSATTTPTTTAPMAIGVQRNGNCANNIPLLPTLLTNSGSCF